MSGRRAKIAGAVAAAMLLVGIAFYVASPRTSTPVVQASPPTSSGLPAATSTGSASPSVAPSPSIAPAAAVRPDAQHGLVTFTNIRSEVDPRDLQQPPAFSRGQMSTFSMAVAPEGKRAAIIRGGPTGQQLITFTTARPNDVTTLVDFSGGGEFATHLVWAGDGSGSLLMVVEKHFNAAGGGDNLIREYSALRSVDLATRQVREIVRIGGQNRSLFPLAWLPGRQLAAALEVRPLGQVENYLLVRNGALERTDPKVGGSVSSFTATRDGLRIAAVDFLGAAGGTAVGVRWWPTDQPAAARDIPGGAAESITQIEFRPGKDEIGVQITLTSPGPGQRFEIWTLGGQRRVVSDQVGFDLWRADGTAAIAGTILIDPETGATTQLPGGAFRVAATTLF